MRKTITAGILLGLFLLMWQAQYLAWFNGQIVGVYVVQIFTNEYNESFIETFIMCPVIFMLGAWLIVDLFREERRKSCQ